MLSRAPLLLLLPVLHPLLLAGTAAAEPGATFIRAHGVFEIDDTGEVTRLAPEAALPNNITVDADGDLWIAFASGKVTAYKARKRTIRLPRSPNEDPLANYPRAMTAAKSGGVWVLSSEHLFKISRGGKVETYGPPGGRAEAIIEHGDALWLANAEGLQRFAAGKWKTARTGNHAHLARDSNGVLWTVRQADKRPDVLVGFDGHEWIEVPIKGGGAMAIAAGKQGRLYLLTWGDGWQGQLDLLTTNGGVAKWTAHRLGGLYGFSELIVDDAERIWTKHEYTLVVLAKDGTLLELYYPGTVRGLHGIMHDLVVQGAGPTTLPVAAPVVKGSVKGRIMTRPTEPLANTKVELCMGDCDGNGTSFEFTTDASGRFKVDDVAALEYTSVRIPSFEREIGSYVDAIPNPRKVVRFECCLEISAGKTLDVGTILTPPGVGLVPP